MASQGGKRTRFSRSKEAEAELVFSATQPYLFSEMRTVKNWLMGIGIVVAMVGMLSFPFYPGINPKRDTRTIPESLPSDELKAIEEKVGRSTVLDFKTESWQLMAGPFGGVYKMIYGVRSRFLRVADGNVLWQGYCAFDDAKSQATLEDLTANGGVLLRDKIDEAATFCAKNLLEQLLTVQSKP